MSHVSIPLIRGGRVSLPRALDGLWLETKDISDCVWTFTIIRGLINKGGIQKRHIFLFWVSKEGHNEQTLSFSTDD